MVRFKCTLCGRCCSDPNLLITLTHKDILRLYQYYNSISNVISNLVLISSPIDAHLVMPTVRIEHRNVIFAIKKDDSGRCIFLDQSNRCKIYNFRPLVCRAFPFTFARDGLWLKWGLSYKATICEGIGQGPEISDSELETMGINIINELDEFSEFARNWNLSVFSNTQKDDLYSFINKILELFS